jgi:DNA/RNA-binding domain of Phe-tRNA-synthetase-like protein
MNTDYIDSFDFGLRTADLGDDMEASLLNISDNIAGRIPGLVIIAGILEVRTPRTESVAHYLGDSWDKLSKAVLQHGVKTHPRIEKWRAALRHAAVPLKNCPPSIEAIAKRTTKSDSPFSINPIVDTYNAISMDLVLPFGAFDLDQMDGSLSLRVCEQPEPFTPLGGGRPEETVAGEIVYADETDILTRHFLWRQAEKGKITNASKRCVFVCELLDTMEEDTVQSTKSLIEEKFHSVLGGTVREVVILR